MDVNLLLWIMLVFVAVSAIALCIQAGMLFGIYKATRMIEQQAAPLIPQAKNVLAIAEATLGESRKHIVDIAAKANEITAKASDIMDNAKVQMSKIDTVVTDATARAKNQLERVEMVVDDTVGRVHESVSAVHHGILVPIRQVNGLAAGLKTAVGVFLRGGRPNVSEATQDTEMFI